MRNYLFSSVLPGHSFFLGNDVTDKLIRQGALLLPCAIPFGLSSLTSSSTPYTGGVPSHLNFLIHRPPWFPLRNLCFLVTLIASSLVFPATDITFSYTLIFLESKILLAVPAVIRPRTDTSHLILHCPATDSLCCLLFVSLQLLVQTLGSSPASKVPWSCAVSSSLARGR